MNKRLPAPLTWLVVVSILAVTVVATLQLQSQLDKQRRDRLEQRSNEIVVTLVSGLSETRSALRVLVNVPLEQPGSPEAFQQAAAPLVTGAVRLVAAIVPSDGTFTTAVAVGDGLANGAPVTGEPAVLVQRALTAKDVVSDIVQIDGETRLAFALATSTHDRVVLRETTVNPTATAQTVANRAFGDVDIALYAAPTADANELVVKTSATVPLKGRTIDQTIPVGADTWLLVTGARGNLLNGYAGAAPWAALGAGIVVALLFGALVEALIRRRRYADVLVDERTAALEEALREQIRLQREARAATAAAAAANRSKSEFLSRMSHELRTPLNAVLGFAQLLELEPLEPDQREAVVQITKGGRHLLDLINEVLDITRIETGALSLSPEAVLARDALEEAVDLVRPLAAASNINLIADPASTCAMHVFADRQRLKQILLNLLSNAIKYNRVGGSVSVQCDCGDGRLQLHIVDTGPGIRPEDLDRLFVPFDRLGAEHGEIEGTGIGLALSRRLAEAMGGNLLVESDLGRGSTFTIDLPIVESPVERYDRLQNAAPLPPPAVTTRRDTLVYIEDNLSNLRLVERILERRGGIELVAAMQGRLGLELARQHRPFAVMLDLHLPDVDGEQVLAQLRDDPNTANIPVIVLSADATPGQVQRLLAAGAHEYLTKPLDVRRLLVVIDELLRAPTHTA